MRVLVAATCSLLVTHLAAQASWSILYPTGSPSPRQFSTLVCFEPTGDVLMLFGSAAGLPVTQHWKLHGNVWSTFPTPPHNVTVANAVYDSLRHRIVTFGGDSSNNETWEWDGAQWSHPNPLVRPIARSECAMAFDRTRGVTVVFGGLDTFGNFLQDLWEWDGATWVQRAATTPLGPRVTTLMAFDPVRQNVILYGGLRSALGSTIAFTDTWAWDGAAWTQHTPSTPPPYDVRRVIATDLHRQRVVLYGGASGGTATWEWDGSEWASITSSTPGGPREGHGMAYDPSGRRTVIFGGTSTGFLVQDTWIYRTPLPANVAPFGSGCEGSAGTPALSAAPYTLPWLGDTMRNTVTSVPIGEPGALFVSSFSTTLPAPLGAIGMPGCDLLVGLDALEFRPAVAERAEWTLAIPNVPFLAGVVFRQQAFVRDAAANPLGFAASNGLVVTIGVR